MTRPDNNRPAHTREGDWVFSSPAEQIKSLEMRLRFARSATAHQRRRASDARWLLARIADALDHGDVTAATQLAAGRSEILAERREHLASTAATPAALLEGTTGPEGLLPPPDDATGQDHPVLDDRAIDT